jgi:SAM-dependent methyltransferase
MDRTPQPVTLEEDDMDERASFGDWDEEERDEPTLSFFSPPPPPGSSSNPCGSAEAEECSVDNSATTQLLSTLVYFPTASQAFDELRNVIGFDLLSFASQRLLDDFSRVRLINYIRSIASKVANSSDKKSTVSDVKQLITDALRTAVTEDALGPSASVWTDELYLHPVLETDGAISYALALSNEDQGPQMATSASTLTVGPETASAVTRAISDLQRNAVNGLGDSTTSTLQQQQRVVELENEIARLQSVLASSRSLIARLTSGGQVKKDNDTNEDDDDEDDDDSGDEGNLHSRPFASDNDGYYFASYDKVSIHASMLGDAIRTEAYRDAILKNRASIEGKTVLDVGCGTGILSLFAERAGAKKVIALDNSNIINDAEAIIAKNASRSDVVTCKRGKAEALELDEKVDIIVSEWMGYALHYEGMLLSVLAARDRLLKPGGMMFPSRSRVIIGAYSDERLIDERVYAWEDVYGFDMSIMRRHVTREPLVETLDPKGLVSAFPHCTVSEIDMTRCTASSIEIEQVPFELILQASGGGGGEGGSEKVLSAVNVHGIALWFDIDFGDERFNPLKKGHVTVPLTSDKEVKRQTVDVDVDAVDGEDDMPLLEEIEADSAATAWRRENARAKEDGKKKENVQKMDSAQQTKSSFVDVSFSTSPACKSTHWHQTLLLFDTPLIAQPSGSILKGRFTMVRDGMNPRELRFRVVIDGVGVDQTWHMR